MHTAHRSALSSRLHCSCLSRVPRFRGPSLEVLWRCCCCALALCQRARVVCGPLYLRGRSSAIHESSRASLTVDSLALSRLSAARHLSATASSRMRPAASRRQRPPGSPEASSPDGQEGRRRSGPQLSQCSARVHPTAFCSHVQVAGINPQALGACRATSQGVWPGAAILFCHHMQLRRWRAQYVLATEAPGRPSRCAHTCERVCAKGARPPYLPS